MEISSPLSSDRANLLVTAGISRNKKDGNTFDLKIFSQHRQLPLLKIHTLVSSSTIPSLYRYTEYLLAKRVCSVSKSESFANDGLIYDIRHPFVSNCRLTKECNIEVNESMPNSVVTIVRGEQDHGLRNLGRRELGRSGILSAAMGSFEATLITAASADRCLSMLPFRDSISFQFVLLGRRLLAVEGRLSVLFRRSSS